MSEYQLEIKQLVDYPRCRIYREFVQALIADRSIRTNGCSGLFCYTVLCSYANFRTSYRRIDGISYTVYPGEWICRLNELTKSLRLRFQRQALDMLDLLEENHLIQYTILGRGKVIKYQITGWRYHNTVLDYNCPCQKDTGFFFLPVTTATELVSMGKCTEMDILLDLWVSAVYRDEQVQGSFEGPVVYFRNGSGCPLASYSELAIRWGISKATVGRLLKKLAKLEYISLLTFPGRHGTAIYLKGYLSTMFQISDVMVDKDEVAMALSIKAEIPEDATLDECASVSDQPVIVSKPDLGPIASKVLQILERQGVGCSQCSKHRYKLGSAEKAGQTKKENRFWKKSTSQRANQWQAFMARRMRAASVLAVSSSLENRRSSPKRRLALPLRPSTALRSQESQYICRLIFASVWSAFLRPKGGPDRRIPRSLQKSLLALV